jgi:hypothetical protein
MIGPDQPQFKLGIRQAHDAGPAPVNQQMHIGSLVIHVFDAVLGLIVLYPRSGPLGTPPGTASAGKRWMGTRLPKDPSVEFRPNPVTVQLARPVDRPAHRGTVGSQIGQARSEAGIHIAFQDFCGRVDVRISVVHAQTVPHGTPPPISAPRSHRPSRLRHTLDGETPPR